MLPDACCTFASTSLKTAWMNNFFFLEMFRCSRHRRQACAAMFGSHQLSPAYVFGSLRRASRYEEKGECRRRVFVCHAKRCKDARP
eukprot:11953393-Alexandrium_andersonii.AAC.1